MSDQKNDFQARLARIQGEQAAPPPVEDPDVYRDDEFPTDENGLIKRTRVEVMERSRAREIMENSVYPLSIVGAFFLGCLAFLLGRYARFHLLGVEAADGDLLVAFAVDIAFSVAIAFVLRMMFQLKLPEHVAAKSFGITAIIATYHNAVHAAPDLWAVLFSEEWVKFMTTVTEPNSIFFGGMTYPLG